MMLTLVVLISLAMQLTPTTTCRSVGLEPTRTWRFEKPGATWRVTHWRGTAVGHAASVSLPATATVVFARDRVNVHARSSNGGIDVTLAGTPAQARLDIYVSYELEVNVDASLTPVIDEIGSDGPIGVRCESIPAP